MTNSYDRILNLLGSLPSSDLRRLKLAVDELVANGYLPAQGHLDIVSSPAAASPTARINTAASGKMVNWLIPMKAKLPPKNIKTG